MGSIPLFRPKPGRVYASAPPNTDTELSTPLGFPCNTFSATNAQPLTSSARSEVSALRPSCEKCVCPGSLSEASRVGAGNGGIAMRLCSKRRAVAAHVENEAEEPSPAPTGRVPRAEKWIAGLCWVRVVFSGVETC